MTLHCRIFCGAKTDGRTPTRMVMLCRNPRIPERGKSSENPDFCQIQGATPQSGVENGLGKRTFNATQITRRHVVCP